VKLTQFTFFSSVLGKLSLNVACPSCVCSQCSDIVYTLLEGQAALTASSSCTVLRAAYVNLLNLSLEIFLYAECITTHQIYPNNLLYSNNATVSRGQSVSL